MKLCQVHTDWNSSKERNSSHAHRMDKQTCKWAILFNQYRRVVLGELKFWIIHIAAYAQCILNLMRSIIKKYKNSTLKTVRTLTLSNLCFLSSFNTKTVLARFDNVSLLMLFDCTPVESSKLGWTSVIVLKKSMPRTAQRSCTVLTRSRTLCNLSLCKFKQVCIEYLTSSL